MKTNDQIMCEVTSCVYNVDGRKCKKGEIKVTDGGIDSSEAMCDSYEKYNGFSNT